MYRTLPLIQTQGKMLKMSGNSSSYMQLPFINLLIYQSLPITFSPFIYSDFYFCKINLTIVTEGMDTILLKPRNLHHSNQAVVPNTTCIINYCHAPFKICLFQTCCVASCILKNCSSNVTLDNALS